MNMSDMKNMIVLKNLPSNLVEEAIIILKENNKIHKYQTVSPKEENLEEEERKQSGYIVKDAEMIIKSYLEKIENHSPQKEKNIKKLEKKYKNSIRLNLFLFLTTVVGIIFSIIWEIGDSPQFLKMLYE